MSTAAATVPAASTTAEQEMLDMLRITVKHWRKESRLPLRYMPEIYWGEVVSAAQMLGVRRVASEVGVSLDELQRRLDKRQGKPAVQEPVAAAPAATAGPSVHFLELPGIAQSVPRTRIANDEAVVEVVAADGATLTVRVPVAHLNISSLVHDFRTGRT